MTDFRRENDALLRKNGELELFAQRFMQTASASPPSAAGATAGAGRGLLLQPAHAAREVLLGLDGLLQDVHEERDVDAARLLLQLVRDLRVRPEAELDAQLLRDAPVPREDVGEVALVGVEQLPDEDEAPLGPLEARVVGAAGSMLGSGAIIVMDDTTDAVKAEPDRPATMIAVNRMPNSRNTEIEISSTTNTSAPKRCSCVAP